MFQVSRKTSLNRVREKLEEELSDYESLARIGLPYDEEDIERAMEVNDVMFSSLTGDVGSYDDISEALEAGECSGGNSLVREVVDTYAGNHNVDVETTSDLRQMLGGVEAPESAKQVRDPFVAAD